MNRIRLFLGTIGAVVISYLIAVYCHEFTHILAAWATGHGFHPETIRFNWLFQDSVCQGAFACSNGPKPDGRFITSHTPPYIMTFIPGLLTLWLLLPRLTGFKMPKDQ